MEPDQIPPPGGMERNIESLHRAGTQRATPDLQALKNTP
jgi:hypothetical protein